MEDNKKSKTSQEKETSKKETPNVVLNEDMNGHNFDNSSYEKLLNTQKNEMKK